MTTTSSTAAAPTPFLVEPLLQQLDRTSFDSAICHYLLWRGTYGGQASSSYNSSGYVRVMDLMLKEFPHLAKPPIELPIMPLPKLIQKFNQTDLTSQFAQLQQVNEHLMTCNQQLMAGNQVQAVQVNKLMVGNKMLQTAASNYMVQAAVAVATTTTVNANATSANATSVSGTASTGGGANAGATTANNTNQDSGVACDADNINGTAAGAKKDLTTAGEASASDESNGATNGDSSDQGNSTAYPAAADAGTTPADTVNPTKRQRTQDHAATAAPAPSPAPVQAAATLLAATNIAAAGGTGATPANTNNGESQFLLVPIEQRTDIPEDVKRLIAGLKTTVYDKQRNHDHVNIMVSGNNNQFQQLGTGQGGAVFSSYCASKEYQIQQLQTMVQQLSQSLNSVKIEYRECQRQLQFYKNEFESSAEDLKSAKAATKSKEERIQKLSKNVTALMENLKSAKELVPNNKQSELRKRMRQQPRVFLPADQRQSFELHFKRLEEHVKATGSCRVRDVNEDGTLRHGSDMTFVLWARSVRRECHQAVDDPTLLDRPNVLVNRDRFERFKALGILEWEYEVTVRTWEERYEDLLEYKRQHGHVKVPKRYSDQHGLGRFVERVRKKWVKMQKDPNCKLLTEEQIKKMDELGFIWVAKESVTWKDRIEECILFKRVHGHLNVPPVTAEDKQNLNKRELSFRTWASRLRGEYVKVKNGKKGRGDFGEERIKELEKLGFVFVVPKPPPAAAAAATGPPSPTPATARKTRRASKNIRNRRLPILKPVEADEDETESDDSDDEGPEEVAIAHPHTSETRYQQQGRYHQPEQNFDLTPAPEAEVPVQQLGWGQQQILESLTPIEMHYATGGGGGGGRQQRHNGNTVDLTAADLFAFRNQFSRFI